MLTEFEPYEKGTAIGTAKDVHIPLIALIDPTLRLGSPGTFRTSYPSKLGISKGFRLALVIWKDKMLKRLRRIGSGIGALARVKQTSRYLVIACESRCHIKLSAYQGSVISVTQGIMCNTGLLDFKVIHCSCKRFLVLIAVGLHIVYELKIDPSSDPIPVKIVYNDILLHDTAIVAAPSDEYGILTTPGTKGLESVLKAVPLSETFLVKACELFDLIMHTPEIYGLDINGKLLGRLHIFIKLYSTDLDDLTTKPDRELVKNGGFGAHSLIPFQVHHDVIHIFNYLL